MYKLGQHILITSGGDIPHWLDEFSGEIVTVSPTRLLVSIPGDDGRKRWIPKSQATMCVCGHRVTDNEPNF